MFSQFTEVSSKSVSETSRPPSTQANSIIETPSGQGSTSASTSGYVASASASAFPPSSASGAGYAPSYAGFPTQTRPSGTAQPPTDLETVLKDEIKEWHFHIYFHQRNASSHHAALELRDAVLRLRRDGAFVAVPLFRVNTEPIGPHPVGSYEIWVPSETFSSVFSYLCMNRGDLSILVHPLTRHQRADHSIRNAWIGPSFPLDLDTLPLRSEDLPLQYPSLKLGYSSTTPPFSPEDRRKLGANIEHILKNEKEAARAPPRA
ncbi:DOPA-like domain-containing protein [Lyophyllum atratum]|nr:DOPA-like domain-containing protein [Lyophyllum atratum]